MEHTRVLNSRKYTYCHDHCVTNQQVG